MQKNKSLDEVSHILNYFTIHTNNLQKNPNVRLVNNYHNLVNERDEVLQTLYNSRDDVILTSAANYKHYWLDFNNTESSLAYWLENWRMVQEGFNVRRVMLPTKEEKRQNEFRKLVATLMSLGVDIRICELDDVAQDVRVPMAVFGNESSGMLILDDLRRPKKFQLFKDKESMINIKNKVDDIYSHAIPGVEFIAE